jgi:hypothetical protein
MSRRKVLLRLSLQTDTDWCNSGVIRTTWNLTTVIKLKLFLVHVKQQSPWGAKDVRAYSFFMRSLYDAHKTNAYRTPSVCSLDSTLESTDGFG